MTILKNRYEELCTQFSDIHEHLPTLVKYAKECKHITEFGVRSGVSTVAFLMAEPEKMLSYDIATLEKYGSDSNFYFTEAKKRNIDFSFHIANVLEIEIEETDLLFIDTEHSYLQLKSELLRHAEQVRKYIVLHDTTTFGHVDSDAYGLRNTLSEINPGDFEKSGLWPAVEEFLEKNSNWAIKEKFDNNNGLTILEKVK